jgi:hypothetical protein
LRIGIGLHSGPAVTGNIPDKAVVMIEFIMVLQSTI